MLILTIRTDKPQAELGLYDGTDELEVLEWQAHRQLAESIHQQISGLLKRHGRQLNEVKGVVIFRGPGSFTGLRIGASVANALAYGLAIPIVGTDGEDWRQTGLQALQNGMDDTMVIPVYGAAPHVTAPKS